MLSASFQRVLRLGRIEHCLYASTVQGIRIREVHRRLTYHPCSRPRSSRSCTKARCMEIFSKYQHSHHTALNASIATVEMLGVVGRLRRFWLKTSLLLVSRWPSTWALEAFELPVLQEWGSRSVSWNSYCSSKEFSTLPSARLQVMCRMSIEGMPKLSAEGLHGSPSS